MTPYYMMYDQQTLKEMLCFYNSITSASETIGPVICPKLNHLGEVLMSCAGINYTCQIDCLIILALELSILNWLKASVSLIFENLLFKMNKLSETQPFSDDDGAGIFIYQSALWLSSARGDGLLKFGWKMDCLCLFIVFSLSLIFTAVSYVCGLTKPPQLKHSYSPNKKRHIEQFHSSQTAEFQGLLDPSKGTFGTVHNLY